MPKSTKTKTALKTSDNTALFSKILLFLGIALFFFSIGIYTAKHFEKTNSQSESQREENVFFVQEIRNGSMVPIKGRTDTFDLSVRNEYEYITFVAQSPTDIAGKVSISEYLGIWDDYFAHNLPTATLIIYDEKENEQITIGQLQKAVKHGEKNRIDYTFRLLNVAELANLTLTKKPNQSPTDKFENATLVITSSSKDLSGRSLIHTLQQVQ